MAKVKITFDPQKVKEEIPRPHANVCSTFEPGNCYIDSPGYEGSRLDSNVYGMDTSVPQKDVYTRTHIPMSVPLAQFDLAIQGEKAEDGTSSVEFEVTDYKEAMYYKQLGADMADQGFTVEVTNAASA